MEETPEHNERIAKLTLASVYPHYVTKVQKKGRTEEELLEVILWLTGFSQQQLQQHLAKHSTFAELFKSAKLHPKAELITGTICGYKIEHLKNPITKQVRYLDKLVDELAKGKSMDKIKRT